MKGLKRLLTILLLLIAAVGAVLFFLPGDSLYEADILLAETDRALDAESWQAAEDYLRDTLDKGKGQAVWLRIVKRSLILAEETGDYDIFYDASHRAVEELPGNELLWAMAVASSLRTQREAQAREEALEYLRSPEYEFLKAEAVFSAEMAEEMDRSSGMTPLERLEKKLEEGRNPRLFERVADELAERRLNMDAAYLWMGKGNTQMAFTNIMNVPAAIRNREAAAYIAMDAGKQDTARQELQAAVEASRRENSPRWDLIALLADSYRRGEEWESAAALYQEVIDSVPAMSWKPYRSLASMYRNTGQIRKIVPLLERGISAFTEKGAWEQARPLYLSLAAYNIDRGERDLARSRIEEYLQVNPGDPEAQLFRFDLLTRDQLSAERREARLWDLFNQHPENRYLAQYLIWYLLGKSDFPGAYLVLDRHRAAAGEEKLDWLGYYRAVIHTLKGDYSKALEAYAQDYEEYGRWASSYNMAVIQDYLGRDTEAGHSLEEAEKRLLIEQPDSVRRNRWLSRIRAMEGKLLLGSNQQDRALKRLQEALSLDPHNRQAQSLKRIIE